MKKISVNKTDAMIRPHKKMIVSNIQSGDFGQKTAKDKGNDDQITEGLASDGEMDRIKTMPLHSPGG